MLITFYFIRARYLIGIPGFQSSLPGSGIVFYLSTTTILSLIAAYGYFSAESKIGIALFVVLLVLYSIYQGLLGWRSGLNEVIYIFLGILLIRKGVLPIKLSKLLLLSAVVFLVVLLMVVELQNIVRISDKSILDIWERLWGIKYLASVTSYFSIRDGDLLTNNYFGIHLESLGYSVAAFHNQVIVGDSYVKLHGNSSTGFGSIFIFGGVIFVSLSFIAIGFLYKFMFVKALKGLLQWVVLYALGIGLLQRVFIEQLDMGVIKHMAAIMFSVLLVYISYKGPGRWVRASCKTRRIS